MNLSLGVLPFPVCGILCNWPFRSTHYALGTVEHFHALSQLTPQLQRHFVSSRKSILHPESEFLHPQRGKHLIGCLGKLRTQQGKALGTRFDPGHVHSMSDCQSASPTYLPRRGTLVCNPASCAFSLSHPCSLSHTLFLARDGTESLYCSVSTLPTFPSLFILLCWRLDPGHSTC